MVKYCICFHSYLHVRKPPSCPYILSHKLQFHQKQGQPLPLHDQESVSWSLISITFTTNGQANHGKVKIFTKLSLSQKCPSERKAFFCKSHWRIPGVLGPEFKFLTQSVCLLLFDSQCLSKWHSPSRIYG